MAEIKSTCCYCGVGCGLVIETQGDAITGVRGDPDHPANFGRLCTKGSTLHLTDRRETRALHPEFRGERDHPRQRASWDSTLDFVAERFAGIITRHGPDAVGFYISGQLLTEEYYVFNKLAKGLIGTNNVDTNSRLCMSSAVSGYKASLGVDAPPTCYDDIAHAQCFFIAGSNTAYAHPILFRRIEDARAANPDLKIIVVDPRRTDTAAAADLHLPILPGSDVALFNAMLHTILWEGLADQTYIAAHTEGFDEIKATVREYTPEAVATICGVPAEDIVQAARWFGKSPATLSLYCQGLNQSSHGTDKNTALINLHLATGQIGRVGAGPFSLTGQPNAMGGREVGGMANLLSGHRNLADPAHRAEVAKLWGVTSVPEHPGKTAVEMFEAVRTGEIKALWIACTNPAQSMPDQKLVREALKTAELVILQDCYHHTETAAYADVFLPAATWGEKDGAMTNSERAVSRVRKAVSPPGEARPDWEIVADFARRLEKKLPARNTDSSATSLFPYQTAEAVFNEHRETTRGRDLDITGLSYALLDAQGPQQWPFPQGATSGRKRLYTDGRFETPTGRARFANVRHQPVAEPTNARYPFHLNTGRLRDQWHGMSRSGSVARLFGHVELPLLTMARQDMDRHNLQPGDLVKVKSRRGEIALHAALGDDVRPGQVFIPMHWGSQYLLGDGVNALCIAAFDPVSKQPELKHAAVRVEKLDYPWQLIAMTRIDSISRQANVQQLMQKIDAAISYASCGLYGRDTPVLVLRVAAQKPLAAEILLEIDQLFGLDDATVMDYRDARRGISKRAKIEDAVLCSVRLTGETAARDWLKEMLATGIPAAEVRRWMLAPLSSPPAGSKRRGTIVCNCLDVAESEIAAQLDAGATLSQLQQRLKCGTECGSCLPEIKRMVRIRANEKAA